MRFLSRNSLLGTLVCLEKVVNEPRNKVTKDSNSQCWFFEEDSNLGCDVIYYLPNENYHSLILPSSQGTLTVGSREKKRVQIRYMVKGFAEK